MQNARSRFDEHDLAKGVGVHFLLPVGGFFQLSRIQEFGAAAAGTVFIDGIVLAHRRVLQMQHFHALIIAHIAHKSYFFIKIALLFCCRFSASVSIEK